MEQLTFHRRDDLGITDDPFKYEAKQLAERHEIEFATELISFPFKTIVYEVTPHKNNNLARIWTDQDKKHHVLQLPAYAAINNRDSGFLDVDAHLRTHAKAWATGQDVYHKEAARLLEDEDAVIRGTMNTLLEYSLGQGSNQSLSRSCVCALISEQRGRRGQHI